MAGTVPKILPCTQCGNPTDTGCSFCDTPYCRRACQAADFNNHRGVCLKLKLNKLLELIPEDKREDARKDPIEAFASTFWESYEGTLFQRRFRIPYPIKVLEQVNRDNYVRSEIIGDAIKMYNDRAKEIGMNNLEKFYLLYIITVAIIQEAELNGVTPIKRGESILTAKLLSDLLIELGQTTNPIDLPLANAAITALQLYAYNLGRAKGATAPAPAPAPATATAAPYVLRTVVDVLDGGYKKRRKMSRKRKTTRRRRH